MKVHRKNKSKKTYSQFMEHQVPDFHHQMLLLFSPFFFPFIPAANLIRIPLSSLLNGTCFPALLSALDPLGQWTFLAPHAASALKKAAILTQALTLAGS